MVQKNKNTCPKKAVFSSLSQRSTQEVPCEPARSAAGLPAASSGGKPAGKSVTSDPTPVPRTQKVSTNKKAGVSALELSIPQKVSCGIFFRGELLKGHVDEVVNPSPAFNYNTSITSPTDNFNSN